MHSTAKKMGNSNIVNKYFNMQFLLPDGVLKRDLLVHLKGVLTLQANPIGQRR